MAKGVSKRAELAAFYNRLVEYEKFCQRFLKGERITRVEKEQLGGLYEGISREVGSLGPFISQMTGIDKVDVRGKEYDMWLIALSTPINKIAYIALGFCIQVTNRAIGRLESDIQMGVRDEQGNLIEKAQKFSPEPPKAFIAHEGMTGALQKGGSAES